MESILMHQPAFLQFPAELKVVVFFLHGAWLPLLAGINIKRAQ